ncbi:histidine kinase [Paenibacillus stellifer]|uniref:histidine kinase n=1 Tax=Paenibacillus stellifer TaxID=169760 RepID=A0A089LRN0_9BACL|nr:histidine kinase [Paenibacillus stellifer]AIQ64211.1 histidine kinase [Paenibacillus stellifer]
MTYRQMKWLILTIPTFTMGLWEYVRHRFLLPYISMDLGNWLAPVVVFIASLLFLIPLFSMIEKNQAELNEARSMQAALQEREQLSRELHDGIMQSLFLLNAQVSRMEQISDNDGILLQSFKESIHRTNVYVREAIANLRYPTDCLYVPWVQGIERLVDTYKQETGLSFKLEWDLPENLLTTKEKIELFASVREALVNIRKHAEANSVRIEAAPTANGWKCQVCDDGKGFAEAPSHESRYGLKMMEDRARTMNWHFDIGRNEGETVFSIRKGEAA